MSRAKEGRLVAQGGGERARKALRDRSRLVSAISTHASRVSFASDRFYLTDSSDCSCPSAVRDAFSAGWNISRCLGGNRGWSGSKKPARDIARVHTRSREGAPCVFTWHTPGWRQRSTISRCSMMTEVAAIEREVARARARARIAAWKVAAPVIDTVTGTALWTKWSRRLRRIKRDGVTSVSSRLRNATYHNYKALYNALRRRTYPLPPSTHSPGFSWAFFFFFLSFSRGIW